MVVKMRNNIEEEVEKKIRMKIHIDMYEKRLKFKNVLFKWLWLWCHRHRFAQEAAVGSNGMVKGYDCF